MPRGEDAEEPVETYVAQRYIHNPYLIGGCKFDMRIFVLVTCFNPLTVWIARDGFARFSAVRYSMKKKGPSPPPPPPVPPPPMPSSVPHAAARHAALRPEAFLVNRCH